MMSSFTDKHKPLSKQPFMQAFTKTQLHATPQYCAGRF